MFYLQWDPGFFENYNEAHPSSSTSLPLCFTAAGTVQRRPPPRRAAGHLLLRPPPHAAPPRPSGPTSPRAGALLPSPRHPDELRGRHLAVAVDSSLQSLSSPTLARLSTRSNPVSLSPPCLARSLPRTPRTSPPSARTPASSKLTIAPHLRNRSARADPAFSATRVSRTSQTPPHPQSTAAARSPWSSAVFLRRRRPARSGSPRSDHPRPVQAHH